MPSFVFGYVWAIHLLGNHESIKTQNRFLHFVKQADNFTLQFTFVLLFRYTLKSNDNDDGFLNNETNIPQRYVHKLEQN